MMNYYTVLSKPTCPYSQRAIKFLEDKRINIKVYNEGIDFDINEFKERYGQDATFPRIYEGKILIGDDEDLLSYFSFKF